MWSIYLAGVAVVVVGVSIYKLWDYWTTKVVVGVAVYMLWDNWTTKVVVGVAVVLYIVWGYYWTTEPNKRKKEESSGRQSSRNNNYSGARTRHTNYSNHRSAYHEGWSGRHSSRNNNNSGARTQMLRHMNHSNPNNNHDHQKQSHASCEEAEFEAARMQRHNPDDTFNAYFNKERDSWYVGRSKYE